MAPPDDLKPTRLVAHSQWLRRLARRLVRDAALAEDVAQETLLVALERAPGSSRRVAKIGATGSRGSRSSRARRTRLCSR